MSEAFESNSTAITSSNKGFQLLKKAGWTEGTGLGAYEQGRLEPIEPDVKKNKRGLGAEKKKKKPLPESEESPSELQNDNDPQTKKKAKVLSKKLRKMKEQEQRLQEQDFERAFFREFWPDNV